MEEAVVSFGTMLAHSGKYNRVIESLSTAKLPNNSVCIGFFDIRRSIMLSDKSDQG
jgi:hypothetical protein